AVVVGAVGSGGAQPEKDVVDGVVLLHRDVAGPGLLRRLARLIGVTHQHRLRDALGLAGQPIAQRHLGDPLEGRRGTTGGQHAHEDGAAAAAPAVARLGAGATGQERRRDEHAAHVTFALPQARAHDLTEAVRRAGRYLEAQVEGDGRDEVVELVAEYLVD